MTMNPISMAYCVVNEWTPEGTDYTLREEGDLFFSHASAKAELERVAKQELPWDQEYWDDPNLVGMTQNYWYIEQKEIFE